jgi:phosphohistidine phosphatase SixA
MSHSQAQPPDPAAPSRYKLPLLRWVGRKQARLAWLVPPLVLVAALTGCGAGGSQETTTAAPSAAPSREERLVAALRAGGHVIYFRHAPTDWVPDDQDLVDLSDCGTQRNLSAAGRGQARAIGEAIQRLDIRIGSVLSSPFCRALDTARLAFDGASPEAALENLETAESAAERELRSDGLRRLLSTPPGGGTNSVLVGHGHNIEAVADVTTEEGDAYVFRPEQAAGFAHVATITPAEWEELADRFAGDR